MSDANQQPESQTADQKRRHRHFQVRLDEKLAAQLQHYADKRHNGVINAALQTLISKFFNGK
jgi:ABC-type nitrate/sulfonate/bicarbonate transport system substrate-binding protein